MRIHKTVCDICGNEILGDLDLEKVFGDRLHKDCYKRKPHITMSIGDVICSRDMETCQTFLPFVDEPFRLRHPGKPASYVMVDKDICQNCFEKLCRFLNIYQEEKTND